MKKIGDYLYDEAGVCPVCGMRMRDVRYFKGEKGGTVKTGTTYSSRGTTTHYSTSYNNLKQLTAGYCEGCAREAFNAKEENWPKPGLTEWICVSAQAAPRSSSCLGMMSLKHNA